MRQWRKPLCLVLLFASCTSERDRLSPAQQRVVDEYVSSSAPRPSYRLEALSDERVELVGYDLDETEWRRDEPLRVTWYWKVLAPPKEGSTLVTEVEHPSRGRAVRLENASPLRRLYPPERWRAGQYVRDEQALALPEDWDASYAMLRVRLAVGDEPAVHGPAVSLATVSAKPASTRVLPILLVVKTKTSPRLDGSLSESVWGFARASTHLDDGRSSGEARVDGNAKMLWDSRFLYVGFDVFGRVSGSSGAAARAPQDCSEACVELWMDPDGDGSNVFVTRVAANGALRSARYTSAGPASGTGTYADWTSRARAAVLARGEGRHPTSTTGFTVEAAIPWQAFSLDGSVFDVPEVGDRWRFKVGVVDPAPDIRAPSARSSSEIDDFHVPRRFGILRFEGAPEEMHGASTPTELPEGRMPAPMHRSVSPSVRESLFEKSAAEKNRIDALRAKQRESQRLESVGGGD